MPKCWSLSTTIRNPKRNIPFLRVLNEFEGIEFNEDIQSAFFKRLIQTKNYKPEDLPKDLQQLFKKQGELTDDELEYLLSQVHYKNKQYNDDQEKIYAMRGRTAIGNLNKMGLAEAKQNTPVKIFDLGKSMLSDSIDFENIVFKYLLKWQLNNPIERGFSKFDIIPFIGTLHVINKVNIYCYENNMKEKGLSSEEFALFIPTLTNYKDIDDTVCKIIDFRKKAESLPLPEKKAFINDFSRQFVIDFFNIDKNDTVTIDTWINNLYDYGDSIRRYFRQTGLVYYRGNGYYTDLSPSRIVEINSILKTFNGSSLHFDSADEYINYLGDISLPDLPWENIETLNQIYKNLISQANHLQKTIENQYENQSLHSYSFIDKVFNNSNEAKSEISKLREKINILRYDLFILKERNLKNLNSYIEKLDALANRRRSTSSQDPLFLEQYSALSLMALDDAMEIHPNYTLGDDNLPTFTAQGDMPDIECYYETFNMVCEVTLLKSKDQWFNEGQPVMRHFRDFEDKSSKDNYCLFIAPLLHRDTVNTFWMSVKYEYEGSRQKIIPFSIAQYNSILEIVLELNNKNYRVKHTDLKKLLENLYNRSNSASSCDEWLLDFDNIINNWKCELISNL